MSDGQAVGDQEDDVLGFCLGRRAINGPGDRLGFGTGRNFDLVVTGAGERDPTQDDGRTKDLVLVLFFGDELRILAESGLVILAVDGDLDVFRLYDGSELDFEIERRTGQDRSTIKRINLGSLNGAGKKGRGDQSSNDFAHIPLAKRVKTTLSPRPAI
ncbi:hypothetical protein D3C86_1500700 [compost metagenome]